MTRTDLSGDAPKPLLIASPMEHPAEHFVTFAAFGTTFLQSKEEPEQGSKAKHIGLRREMFSLMTERYTGRPHCVLIHSSAHSSYTYSL